MNFREELCAPEYGQANHQQHTGGHGVFVAGFFKEQAQQAVNHSDSA